MYKKFFTQHLAYSKCLINRLNKCSFYYLNSYFYSVFPRILNALQASHSIIVTMNGQNMTRVALLCLGTGKDVGILKSLLGFNMLPCTLEIHLKV